MVRLLEIISCLITLLTYVAAGPVVSDSDSTSTGTLRESSSRSLCALRSSRSIAPICSSAANESDAAALSSLGPSATPTLYVMIPSAFTATRTLPVTHSYLSTQTYSQGKVVQTNTLSLQSVSSSLSVETAHTLLVTATNHNLFQTVYWNVSSTGIAPFRVSSRVVA